MKGCKHCLNRSRMDLSSFASSLFVMRIFSPRRRRQVCRLVSLRILSRQCRAPDVQCFWRHGGPHRVLLWKGYFHSARGHLPGASIGPHRWCQVGALTSVMRFPEEIRVLCAQHLDSAAVRSFWAAGTQHLPAACTLEPPARKYLATSAHLTLLLTAQLLSVRNHQSGGWHRAAELLCALDLQ